MRSSCSVESCSSVSINVAAPCANLKNLQVPPRRPLRILLGAVTPKPWLVFIDDLFDSGKKHLVIARQVRKIVQGGPLSGNQWFTAPIKSPVGNLFNELAPSWSLSPKNVPKCHI
jgi:hypothetical protein